MLTGVRNVLSMLSAQSLMAYISLEHIYHKYTNAILAILIHQTTSTLSVSTSTISRSLELSLQSSLQLSFTVLVCYRIRVRI